MEFINEYGLLIAVATPVGAIACINLLLAFAGERGTLLFPSLRPYPSVLEQAPAAVEVAAPQPAVVRAQRPAVTAGFDEADEMLARQAA